MHVQRPVSQEILDSVKLTVNANQWTLTLQKTKILSSPWPESQRPMWRKGMGNTYTQPHVFIVLRAIERGLISVFGCPCVFSGGDHDFTTARPTVAWVTSSQYRGFTRRASTIQSCGLQPLRDPGTLSLGGLPSGKPMVAGHLFSSVLCPL